MADFICAATVGGSPPRVRGTGIDLPDGVDDNRITPACAGNRDDPEVREIVLWDHPRVCGEQR